MSRNLRDLFPFPYTEADADDWLAFSAAMPAPPGVYAIEVGGEGAGTVSLRRHVPEERFTAEIGYWLAEPFWGRGIMTQAIGAVIAAAFAEPDYFRIFAPVFSWNAQSMRVLEKNGFQKEGVLKRSAFKDGTLLDQVMLAVTRDPGLPYMPAA